MSANYEVGFGKPPAAGKWKKGQSGNPLGSSMKARERARKAHDLTKAKSLAEMMVEELCETITPNVDGRQQSMTVAKALSKTLMRDVLNGSSRNRRETIKLLDKLGVLEQLAMRSDEEELQEYVLTPTEVEMLETAAKIAAEMDHEEAEHAASKQDHGSKPDSLDLEGGMLGS